MKLRGVTGIFAIAGMGSVVGLVISLVTFAGERLGWTPFWSLLNIPALSVGDNIILFIVLFWAACFLAVWLLAWITKLWKW